MVTKKKKIKCCLCNCGEVLREGDVCMVCVNGQLIQTLKKRTNKLQEDKS